MNKVICVLFFALASLPGRAQVQLPRIIRDSMVLQRAAKIKIWGWAGAGEKVAIQFKGKKYKTVTASDGKWSVFLAPEKAGGPYEMQITGRNKIVLNNILIGEVWLCSGQSNMEHQLALHSVVYDREIANAHYPEIRQFKVPNITNLQEPQKELPGGNWKAADPEDVKQFSAVAYFFAKALYEKYHVPIGLINATWGGSPIEAWMSEESLKTFPEIYNSVLKNRDTAYINSFALGNNESKLPGIADKGLLEKWFSPDYIPAGWRTIAVPGYWEDQGIRDLDGAVWYRREVEVPAAMTKQQAKVFLGRIVDADELYINGVKVGSTSYLYPQRRYPVPEGLLKPEKNLFVVRVVNNSGKGGFVPDKPYQLIAGGDTIALTGYWQYKVGQVYVPQQRPNTNGFIKQYQPTALYNAMLWPVMGYTIRGFAWYQGESNTGKPDVYSRLQPAMITDWRSRWGQGSLPFLFVQLPGYMEYNYLPSESAWALFREAQAKSLSLPNTGMPVAIDLGEWNDVHPDRKKEVGDRLALAAEKVAYKEDVVYSGPVFQSSQVEENRIIVTFNHTGSGLTTSDGAPPAEFAIAGADKKFVWADARIDGPRIILSNDKIAAPEFVRYAWADDPVNPNLINKEGLPAAPFRTDQ